MILTTVTMSKVRYSEIQGRELDTFVTIHKAIFTAYCNAIFDTHLCYIKSICRQCLSTYSAGDVFFQ